MDLKYIAAESLILRGGGVSELLGEYRHKMDAMKASIAESVLLINATNVGMGDLEGISVVPAELLVEGLVVADVIYVPRKTELLEDAEAKGLKTINGLGMLLWQAAIAEDIWVGKEMPTELVQEKFFD